MKASAVLKENKFCCDKDIFHLFWIVFFCCETLWPVAWLIYWDGDGAHVRTAHKIVNILLWNVYNKIHQGY